MFYLAVVLEKGQVIDRGFDAQDEAELVVEFQRDRPHGVFDPRSFDAGVKAIAHLALELWHEFLAQEGGDVIGLDGVDCRAAEVLIDRFEVGLLAEDDIGRVFTLVHAPVISHAEGTMNGTEATREHVQPAVQPLDR